MPKVVEPDGPDYAEIVILGEAPGAKEADEGRGFVGPSGKMLWGDILGRARIFRQQCKVMNVYWEQPPGNAFDRLAEPGKYWRETVDLIKAHPRKVIIAVGEQALRWLTGRSGITKWRGSVLADTKLYYESPEDREVAFPVTDERFTVIPMIHPAAVLRQFSWLVLCRHDGRRAAKVLDEPGLRPPALHIHTFDSVMEACGGSQLEAYHFFMETLESYKHAPCLSFDIETYAKTITCLGLGRSDRDAIVVPFTGAFVPQYEASLAAKCKDVLEGSALKIGQNLDYDVQYLFRCLNIGVRNVWMDTMVAHSVMHPEMSHALDMLCSLYTLQPYYKEMRKEGATANYGQLHWLYNGTDACVTFEVGCRLFDEMQSTNTWQFFNTVSMPVTKTLVRMEHKGVLVDESLREERKELLQREVDELMARPDLHEVNPKSPKQILEYFAAHHVKLPKTRGKKTPSTDEISLKLLRQKAVGHEKFIDAILEVRARRQLISTFLNAKASDDGRMRTSYRTSSTDTGRISSSADVFGNGMNLQNVPVAQRDWFVADPGRVFWAADASQIEARITAWLSGDQTYVEAFLQERDIHSENASALFGIPIDKKTVYPGTTHLLRDIGKRSTHAMNYMVGPRTLLRLINSNFPEVPFTFKDAQKFIERFKSLYPGVVSWWARIIDHLTRSRLIVTPFGRRRVFLGRWDDALFKAAVAFLPQSTAADHINSALIRIEAAIEQIPDADVLLQTHDEIAGQCRPEHIDTVREIVVREMQQPLPITFNHVALIVPAEFSWGKNWREAHG